MNADGLFVVDRGRSFALRRTRGWDTVAEAGSREELDVRLAAMGLEVDWASKSDVYSIWPVRELPMRRRAAAGPDPEGRRLTRRTPPGPARTVKA